MLGLPFATSHQVELFVEFARRLLVEWPRWEGRQCQEVDEDGEGSVRQNDEEAPAPVASIGEGACDDGSYRTRDGILKTEEAKQLGSVLKFNKHSYQSLHRNPTTSRSDAGEGTTDDERLDVLGSARDARSEHEESDRRDEDVLGIE